MSTVSPKKKEIEKMVEKKLNKNML